MCAGGRRWRRAPERGHEDWVRGHDKAAHRRSSFEPRAVVGRKRTRQGSHEEDDELDH